MLSFFATTAKGMEPLLVAELEGLGAQQIEERRAGASFAGPLETAYRTCLWSRVSSRILLPLATFPARDAAELYDGVRAVVWGDHLAPGQTLAVDFATSQSALSHSHFGALKTKDAIVDQLRDQRGGRPSVKRERPDVRVNVYLHADQATVSIDLSGESLHRRGYRASGGAAPLKESLAAAVLLLGGWPELAAARRPLIDPMCGSGTLLIEAALIAAERAPGLERAYFGFQGWRGHDCELWRRLVAEAKEREITEARRLSPIRGYDADPRAVRAALANIERARLHGKVHVERGALTECAPPGGWEGGLVVTNPPYGERLGALSTPLEPAPAADGLGRLYQQLGDVLRRRFPGWTALVLTSDLELAKQIGLRAARRHILYNGALECRLLQYPLSSEPVRGQGPAWRRPTPGPGSEAFANRLRKNARHLAKWARREGVSCYRLYDADLPEYAVAVDRYERWVHVQEYECPPTVDAAQAAARLRDVVALVPEVLEVEPEDVFLKVRRRQRGTAQYGKLATRGRLLPIAEGGYRFLANLSDYVNTGLFLDQRLLRALLGRLAAGRRFLNLFAYTGTATVYSAGGGAVSTTSVDLSPTYLTWAQKNLDLNRIRGPRHRLVRADVRRWLAEERSRYGLVFVAPPTFSNSSRMSGSFDVQRDHIELLTSIAERLEPDGVIVFANSFRRFKMESELLTGLEVENISAKTLPPDFARHPRAHNVWRLRRT